MMQVILKEDMPNLGKAGDIVSVKDGYGRNYLLPQRLAVAANTRNVSQVEHQKRVVEIHRKKVTASSMETKAAIEAVVARISRAVGDEKKLFGSVTSRDITDALEAMGVSIDRRLLELEEPIKSLGDYEVEVRLPQGVRAIVKVQVVAKAD